MHVYARDVTCVVGVVGMSPSLIPEFDRRLSLFSLSSQQAGAGVLTQPDSRDAHGGEAHKLHPVDT